MLEALIFDFLNYASGRLDPSHAAIAKAAAKGKVISTQRRAELDRRQSVLTLHATFFKTCTAPRAPETVLYLAPVRGEGDLSIVLRVAHLGRTSLTIGARVQSPDGGVRFAEGATRLVRLDPESFRPAPWSDRFRAIVGPLVSRADAAAR